MVEDSYIKYLETVPTGYATDALRRLGLAGWMDHIYPITSNRKKICGQAVTVKFGPKRGDKKNPENLYSIIAKCKEGDILVVGALGTTRWILGENVIHMALYQGMSGVVVDGCIRDFAEISDMAIPVFCKGASVRPYIPELELVTYQEPILCGGAQVNPDDILVGDPDGVVVLPSGRIPEIVKQAKDIEELEEEQEKIITEGRGLVALNELLKRKKELKK